MTERVWRTCKPKRFFIGNSVKYVGVLFKEKNDPVEDISVNTQKKKK